MALRLADILQKPGVLFEIGTIDQAPGDGTVVVSIGGTDITLPHMRSYVPAINDSVVILTQGQRRIVLDAYVNPADPITPRAPAPPPSQPKPKPPAPPPKPAVSTRTFLATSTACFRNGKWRTDSNRPHQGDWDGAWGRNTGAWFYGSGIYNALHGATVLNCYIYSKRVSGGVYGAVSPTIYTMSYKSRPGGAPSLQGGSHDLPAQAVSTTKWLKFPVDFAQRLVDGSAFSIACWVNSDSPYMVFGNISDSRSSGALKITYRK